MYNHDKQVYNLIMYNHDKQTTLDSDSERGQSPQRAIAPDDDDELMMNNVGICKTKPHVNLTPINL